MDHQEQTCPANHSRMLKLVSLAKLLLVLVIAVGCSDSLRNFDRFSREGESSFEDEPVVCDHTIGVNVSIADGIVNICEIIK